MGVYRPWLAEDVYWRLADPCRRALWDPAEDVLRYFDHVTGEIFIDRHRSTLEGGTMPPDQCWRDAHGLPL